MLTGGAIRAIQSRWITNKGSNTTTVLSMQFVGTPVSGNVYTVNFACWGT
jgi:hypothetical protein